MNAAVILSFLKALLPTKRIAGWILGVIAAGVAVVMGVKSPELKEQFCSQAPVELPQLAPAAPVVPPAPEKK